jgi:hypothetical protein
MSRIKRGCWMVIVMGMVFFGVGCSSTPKIDWDSRIGTYTYDQAVIELGPPDRSAELSDGHQVLEWYVGSGSAVSFGVGTGFYGRSSAVGVGQSVGSGPSGRYLRLTFDPEGRLAQWERVRR